MKLKAITGLINSVKNTQHKISTFLANMLSDDKGNISSLRVNLTSVTQQWALVISFSVIWITFKNPELLAGVLIPVGTIMLGLWGVKWGQKKVENSTPDTTEDTPADK